MGSGKSTVGKRLAARLGLGFMDTDELIEQQEGMSIPEIFQEHGEGYFRQVEQQVVAQAAQRRDTVVATGGGVVLDPENMESLKAGSLTVWLRVDADAVMARTQGGHYRPLLQGTDPKQRIAEMLAQREPLYAAHADLQMDTTVMDEREVVEGILRELAQRG